MTFLKKRTKKNKEQQKSSFMRKEKALQSHGKEMRLDNLPQGQALQDQKRHVCQVEALVAARKVRRWELLSECIEHLDLIRTQYNNLISILINFQHFDGY